VSEYELTVDLSMCQGYASCVMAAPELFDIDDASGKAVLLQASPSAEQLADAEESVRVCPAGAISLSRSS